MASRKGININIPKYFMAVKNCINIFLLYGLEVRTSLLTCSYIGELRNGRKSKCENEPFIVLTLILRRVLSSFCFLIQLEFTAVGMNLT